MYWLEVKVVTDGEGAEAVAEALKPYAHDGTVVLEQLGDESDSRADALEPDVTVKIVLHEKDDTPARRRRIEETLYHLGRLYPLPAPEFRKVADEDWANAWKEHYQPIRVGSTLWIRPSWLSASDPDSYGHVAGPTDNVIILDPGMAFGTGTHPTTQMCLSMLEQKVREGDHVLDVGTGSAVLSIAAAKLGGARILGIDTEEQAVVAADLNVSSNSVQQQVEIRRGTLATVREKPWDIVVVNILAEVIKSLLAEAGLLNYVKDDGYLLLSGILDEQGQGVREAVAGAGGMVKDVQRVRDWISFVVCPVSSTR